MSNISQCVNVLVACPGIGHINRGFETFAIELAESLATCPGFQLSLYGGALSQHGAVIVTLCLKRKSSAARRLARLLGRDPYFVEQATFALALLPQLILGKPDVIITSDGALCNILARFRRVFRLRYRILFSNGGPYSPPYPACDHVHQVLSAELEKAKAFGYRAEMQSLVPYGFRIDRDAAPPTPEQVKTERDLLGLPQGRRILVSVGAINRSHKRMDHLIQEVAGIPAAERPFVVILGQHDDESASVLELILELLGEGGFLARCVPAGEVRRYLRASDVFVLCSLAEGFGRVIVEAMTEGLPCVLHDAEFAREVGGEMTILVDQTKAGALAQAVKRILYQAEDPNSRQQRRDEAYARLSWDVLLQRYVEMVQQTRGRA
jgi:1,2-diacylglycerol 3-alpha-glucosyltransferase